MSAPLPPSVADRHERGSCQAEEAVGSEGEHIRDSGGSSSDFCV